jgi:hypothetical protein
MRRGAEWAGTGIDTEEGRVFSLSSPGIAVIHDAGLYLRAAYAPQAAIEIRRMRLFTIDSAVASRSMTST